MNIVITGVAGLLGSHVSRHLLSKGHKVIGIDNFFGGYKDFLPKDDNFKFYKLNLEKDIQEIKTNLLLYLIHSLIILTEAKTLFV